MTTEWPFPFGGIACRIYISDDDRMREVAAYMAAGCERDHRHNVAFQFDGNVVYTTLSGEECIRRYLDGRA